MVAATLTGLLRGLKRAAEPRDEEPIRDELYSVERLEQYAATLAAGHEVYPGRRRGRMLLPGLERNGRLLIAAYRALAEAVRAGRAISPAAEWLIDNFHVVEEQLRGIREDLPQGYYYELPKLSAGELADYPRIYAVVLSPIAHTDSRLDAETLRRFVRAYQQTTPLTIGNVGLHGKQTWVDIVITPTVGAAWLVAEDALDRFVVRRIERKFDHRPVRLVARVPFNPNRSSANLLRVEKPWRRDR